ncbi:rhodanese domain-containing protein [Trifolium repens]|nr:rhodanese domain-containing protein [Trifolium repens]
MRRTRTPSAPPPTSSTWLKQNLDFSGKCSSIVVSLLHTQSFSLLLRLFLSFISNWIHFHHNLPGEEEIWIQNKYWIMIAHKTILFYLMLGICMKQGLGNFMHQMFELWIHELGSIVISPRGYRAEWLNGKNILMEIRSISFREGRRDRTVWLAAPSNCYSVKSAYGF